MNSIIILDFLLRQSYRRSVKVHLRRIERRRRKCGVIHRGGGSSRLRWRPGKTRQKLLLTILKHFSTY